jgi:phytoene dehydrogenase-like protein
MLYLGIDGRDLGDHFPLHHQVIVGEPLGEGNSVFLSLSPAWDAQRAPAGMRALTLSTHTDLRTWWQLQATDPEAYATRKEIYQERLLTAAERALPGLRSRVRLALPATSVTFERFTRRHMGWVGGFPQTSLLRGRGPRIARNLWLVGDSIFPGQSTAAVALGGLRVSRAVLNERSSS